VRGFFVSGLRDADAHRAKRTTSPRGISVSEIDLNSQEFKDALRAAVAEETEGLRNKNTELLGKLKKAQKDSAIDPDEHAALEAERDDLKGKLQAADKASKKLATDLEAATKRASEIDSAFANTLRDSALTEALAKSGVTNPVHLKAAKALLASSVQVVDENGTRVVKAGDKALADHITEWAAGDEGKHFVAAPHTSGGGSQGSSRANSTAKAISRTAFDALDATARMAHIRDGGQVSD
jgi:predicted nuclease with TOPRIM domain